jgi:hypothetical protein
MKKVLSVVSAIVILLFIPIAIVGIGVLMPVFVIGLVVVLVVVFIYTLLSIEG